MSGAGTGGTIAGVSRALKRHSPGVRVYLVDPPGSGLYNKVTRGVLYAPEEAEGKRLRHPFDTITGGVGRGGGRVWCGAVRCLQSRLDIALQSTHGGAHPSYSMCSVAL